MTLLRLPHYFTWGLSLCHSYCVRRPSATLTKEKKPTFQTQPKWSQLSQVGHCSSGTPCFSHLPSWSYFCTINSYLLSFASQQDSSPQTQTPRKPSASWWFFPANIVCHRIYSQQVSVMITSEHASRSFRSKGASRRWVCPVTTESLSHSVNALLWGHSTVCTSPFTGLHFLLSTLGVGPLCCKNTQESIKL